MADGYTTAFNALKRLGDQARPFQVLIRVEHEVVLYETQIWEDLLTGEKRQTRKKLNTFKGTSISWNPFQAPYKAAGPYFLNRVEKFVKRFYKADEEGRIDTNASSS